MQTESNLKPKKFKIEDLGNGKCVVSFFDNIVEQEISQVDSEETTIKYVYDMYKITINSRPNLIEELENKFDDWLMFAKDCEYEKLATEVRMKRNEMLKETDAEMCLDRMGLDIPEEITATNLLSVVVAVFKALREILMGKNAKYRQELRDLTKQEGFPYNIVWPTKDENKED